MNANVTDISVEAGLTRLRGEIDTIDEQIIALLHTRCKHVQQVGHLKESQGTSGSFIRPKREADMIKHIVSEFDDCPFSAEAAANIWRNIIGASLQMESPLNIAALCPDGSLVPYFMAREYFGSFLPSKVYPQVEPLLHQLEEDPHSIGIINLNDQSSTPPWWLQLALSEAPLHIFACIPFVQRLSGTAAQNPFLAIGQVEVEETDSDISYLAAMLEYPHPGNAATLIAEWLSSGDFRGASVSTIETGEDQWASLIKLQGFAAKDEALFYELQNHLMQMSDGALYDLRFLGSHATPCILDEEA